MNAEFRRVKEIFLAAVEKPDPTERDACVHESCGQDEDLRRQVYALLCKHAQAGSFLESPAPSPVVTVDESPVLERPGTVIGPYKLLQQIGEGGMGTVFMAEQTHPVQRKVALKVIKPGMDSRQVIARFEAERQALAMMDHVNIARVFDGGTTGGEPGGGSPGRPYFVMELVHGVPITKYCDDNHLTPRERLELFVPVCQAIQHAHQKGIIHRDIKPSNVMVTLYDGKPVPKVIDFGVAKAIEQKLTERTLFTQYGAMVGTPQYMSPEQAEMSALGADTRSDIFSLGVLLYELLTGSTPLSQKRVREAAYGEVLRMIREEEAPKPSTRLSDSGEALASISANRHMEPAKLTKLVRGELDWIVMKCLEKDRNRRYETAKDFAADVQRYLDDETVQACPPSASYRLRKFARRNRAAVVTAAAILFVLVAGIAGTTFGLIRAEHRRAEAEQARGDEAAQRLIADAEKKKAEQAEEDTLADYRASTDDAIEQLIGSRPDLGPQEKTYLERTLKRWRAFAARQGEDQRSQAIRAEGHFRMASLWQRLGRQDEARAEYEATRDVLKKLIAAFPGAPLYATYLAQTHGNLATMLAGLGQGDAARTEYEAARDLFKKLAAAFPAMPQYKQELACCQNNLGILLVNLNQRDAARAEYEAARDLQKKLVAAFPAMPQYEAELARSHNNLGELMAGLGQGEAARAEYETARDLQKKLAAAFPAMPQYEAELARSHNNLGALLSGLSQRDAARTEYQTARDLFKKLAAAFPAMPQYKQDLARCQNNLGLLLVNLNQRDAARAEYEAARDLQKKLVAAFPAEPEYQWDLARTHDNLGILLKDHLGQREAARTEYETARDLLKKLTAAFPAASKYQVARGFNYCNLGTLVRDEGKPADSLLWFDLAIRTLTPVYEQDRRHVKAREFLRNGHWSRALAYDQLKKHAEAAKDWDKAIELGTAPEQWECRASRAISRLQAGQVAEAVAEVEELTKASKWSAGQWYNFACVYAVASTKIAVKKQEYADRAMELLRQAVTAGFKDAAHMAKDADLDPLRGREDFKKLIAELEAKKK